jgi:hypothetical protein
VSIFCVSALAHSKFFFEGLYAGIVVKCAKGNEMGMAAIESEEMMVLLI